MYSVQFSSVAKSCPTLCDPMNHSTPGLPVHHQLPEFTQTQVHRVGGAIQPSHSLSSPSPPAPQSLPASGSFQSPKEDRNIWKTNGQILPQFDENYDLQNHLELTRKKDVLYIIGDWNAKAGSQELPGLTGKFALGVQNEAGQRLTEFCQENSLVIANTLFEQHKRQLYTQTSPDGQY